MLNVLMWVGIVFIYCLVGAIVCRVCAEFGAFGHDEGKDEPGEEYLGFMVAWPIIILLLSFCAIPQVVILAGRSISVLTRPRRTTPEDILDRWNHDTITLRAEMGITDPTPTRENDPC